VKIPFAAAFVLVPLGAMIAACSSSKPTAEAPRPVRTAEVRYDTAAEQSRYTGTIQARHEVEQGFRVGGKVIQRRVDVGQAVHAGDVIAILDDTDFRLAEQAALQQSVASAAKAWQADADRKRLAELKVDGSVSASDSERAESSARMSKAGAEADLKQLDLARNRLAYTTLRASQSGVVTAVKFEVGQVVAEGQPVVTIANNAEPEVVVDVPEGEVDAFKAAHFKAALADAPTQTFDVELRELSPQAAAQTRTYRARMKPVEPRGLPLGATATLLVQGKAGQSTVAAIPSAALTQVDGKPAVWLVRAGTTPTTGTVSLTPVDVQGYRNDQALISGPHAGDLVVTAGVQKMAPGLQIALSNAPSTANAPIQQAAR
jgi:RND family efflux transporter MFP subunit